jgi:hypothetical protein
MEEQNDLELPHKWRTENEADNLHIVSSSSSASLSSCSDSSSDQDALFSDAADFSVSYSSCSSSSVSEIVWVDRSHDKKFDSPMWKLGLFLCSREKYNGGYKVKCVICARTKPGDSVWVYDGTSTFLYHAQKFHPKEEKVAEWIRQKAASAARQKEAKEAEEHKLGNVCLSSSNCVLEPALFR